LRLAGEALFEDNEKLYLFSGKNSVTFLTVDRRLPTANLAGFCLLAVNRLWATVNNSKNHAGLNRYQFLILNC